MKTGLELLNRYARKWAREDEEMDLDAKYHAWHEEHKCEACNGNGMIGPLSDPDPCAYCFGDGHYPPFDEFEDVKPGNWRPVIEVDQTR